MPSPRSDDKQVPTERSLYMHHTAPCAAPPGSVPVNENASTPFNLRRHWRSRGSCGASHPGRRESTRSGVRIERPFRTMGDEGLTHEVYFYAEIHARRPIPSCDDREHLAGSESGRGPRAGDEHDEAVRAVALPHALRFREHPFAVRQ